MSDLLKIRIKMSALSGYVNEKVRFITLGKNAGVPFFAPVSSLIKQKFNPTK